MTSTDIENFMVEVTPSGFMKLLKACVEACLPFLVTGEPGVGKTQMTRYVVEEELGMKLMILHPVTDDPTDYKGFPFIVENRAEFLPYGALRAIMEATEPLVVFFDDFGQASGMVQAAIMQLFGGREINGKVISEHVRFVFATNRKGDRAGVSGLLEPVKSRCVTIVNLIADLNEWTQWWLQRGGYDAIPSFFNWRPQHMSAFKPTAEIVNTPTLRGWENVGKLIKLNLDEDLELMAICGAVGAAAGNEFCGYLKRRRHLVDPNLILANPTNYDVPPEHEIDTLWALSGALAALVERKSMPNFVAATKRLPSDFMITAMNMATARDPELKNTAAFAKFVAANQDMILMQ